jgi:hypothetical protein
MNLVFGARAVGALERMWLHVMQYQLRVRESDILLHERGIWHYLSATNAMRANPPLPPVAFLPVLQPERHKPQLPIILALVSLPSSSNLGRLTGSTLEGK